MENLGILKDSAEKLNIIGARFGFRFQQGNWSIRMGFYVSVFGQIWFLKLNVKVGKTLFAYIEVCIANNGWISKTYTISGLIRQGCPLSAICLSFL